MNTNERSALASVPLFAALAPDDLDALASRMVDVRVADGGTIFLEREPGLALYIVKSGKVRIWVQDADANDVTLSELEPGAFFGEMAVLDGGKRSANATAMGDTTLHCLESDQLEAFLLAHPGAALQMIRSLGARLRQTNTLITERGARNANVIHERSLSRLDRLAVAITDRIGSFGFFLIIAAWTLSWTGYNILASLVPALHWVSFDPFPAFVAYLLISNVIQILLMPLIMVGQNLQSRHAETRAELDFDINQKAEKEVVATLRHLERNTELLLQLMHHLDCRVSDEDLRNAAHQRELTRAITSGVTGRSGNAGT